MLKFEILQYKIFISVHVYFWSYIAVKRSEKAVIVIESVQYR